MQYAGLKSRRCFVFPAVFSSNPAVLVPVVDRKTVSAPGATIEEDFQ